MKILELIQKLRNSYPYYIVTNGSLCIVILFTALFLLVTWMEVDQINSKRVILNIGFATSLILLSLIYVLIDNIKDHRKKMKLGQVRK